MITALECLTFAPSNYPAAEHAKSPCKITMEMHHFGARLLHEEGKMRGTWWQSSGSWKGEKRGLMGRMV